MPNPEPQPCGLCDYKTPAGCPTWRDHLEALRLHVETFHRQDSAQQAAAGTGASIVAAGVLSVESLHVESQGFKVIAPRGAAGRGFVLT